MLICYHGDVLHVVCEYVQRYIYVLYAVMCIYNPLEHIGIWYIYMHTLHVCNSYYSMYYNVILSLERETLYGKSVYNTRNVSFDVLCMSTGAVD